MDAAAVSALLSELFPVDIGYHAFFFTGQVQDGPRGDLRATFQIVTFEPGGAPPWHEGRSIRDVKEQELYLVPGPVRDAPERVAAYLRGWAAALHLVVDGARAFEQLMPADLLDVDVLRLQRARTEEDFRRALLQRTRLGKLVPGLAPAKGAGKAPPAPMPHEAATLAWLGWVLADLLPLCEGHHRLEVEPGCAPTQTEAGVAARLVLLRADQRQAEEVLLLPGAGPHESRRVRAYLCGWASALQVLFSERRWQIQGGAYVETRWDLRAVRLADLAAPMLLCDKTLEHQEEFTQALLAPALFGRYMAEATCRR